MPLFIRLEFTMKQTCKRLLLFVLVLASILALSACSAYPEEKGTDEERMKIASLDGHLYPTYDLYRFVFLSNKQNLLREGVEGDALFAACDAAAKEEIYRLYALFSLCEKNEIDPYSKEIDKEVNALLKELIEGDGKGNEGYGSFEAYLAAIKENYMTDRVSRLYIRYAVCEARLAKALTEKEAFKVSDEDLAAFYNGEELVNVMWAYFSPEMQHFNDPALVAAVINNAKNTKNSEDFYKIAVNYQNLFFNMTEEMEGGVLVAKRQLSLEYKALTDAIFALSEGQTSEEIRIGYSEKSKSYGIYIAHRLAKPTLDLTNEEQRAEVEESYKLNAFYKLLEEEAARLKQNTRYYDFYHTITLETVTMP